jgi:hypothetical protein
MQPKNNINQSNLPSWLRRYKLRELMVILKIKDLRTVERWCLENDVTILSEIGGKYVLEDDFKLGSKKKVVPMMIKKLGSEWEAKLSGLDTNANSPQQQKKIISINQHKNEGTSTAAQKFREHLGG